MKIAITVTVTVDPGRWDNLYGTDAADIRDEVITFVNTALNDSAAAQAGAITAAVRAQNGK